MDVRIRHNKGWVPKNWCLWTVVLEKTLESPLNSKEIQPVNPKVKQPWIFIGRTDAEAEAPILGPLDAKSWLTGKDWCWERLKAGGEGDDRGWGGSMASPTQRTWVWANSGRWWRTRKPGVLQFMGLQNIEHDRVTQQQHSDSYNLFRAFLIYDFTSLFFLQYIIF